MIFFRTICVAGGRIKLIGQKMKIAKAGLLIISVLATLAGLIWMGQGAGIIRYPATSFMIDQSPWIWRGAMVAVAGAIGVWLARPM
jgi:hypothetical protein